jgi:hypothetical protein
LAGAAEPVADASFLLLLVAVVLFVIAAFDAGDRGKLLSLGLAFFAGSFAL